MKISRIYAENYKTYRHLDLNLEVEEDRPIILIGGGNGCGKTTLFDAIYHALYGLTIKTPKQFNELFNAGVMLEPDFKGGEITLQIDFSGMVLGREQQYTLKRIYCIVGDHVAESVQLKMGGNTYIYGSAQPASQRAQNEEVINKIITANLPSELSTYFLFDAMKTSDFFPFLFKKINKFNDDYVFREVLNEETGEFELVKITNKISWSWIWVLSPIWITFLFAIIIFAIILIVGRIKKGKW